MDSDGEINIRAKYINKQENEMTTSINRVPSVTLSDEQRSQAFYEWGLNCQILGYEPPKANKILEDFADGSIRKVYEVFEVDAFWNGFHNGHREHGEIVPIHISL